MINKVIWDYEIFEISSKVASIQGLYLNKPNESQLSHSLESNIDNKVNYNIQLQYNIASLCSPKGTGLENMPSMYL